MCNQIEWKESARDVVHFGSKIYIDVSSYSRLCFITKERVDVAALVCWFWFIIEVWLKSKAAQHSTSYIFFKFLIFFNFSWSAAAACSWKYFCINLYTYLSKIRNSFSLPAFLDFLSISLPWYAGVLEKDETFFGLKLIFFIIRRQRSISFL